MRWSIILMLFFSHAARSQFEVLDIPASGVVETACGNGMCMVADWETFISKTYNLGDSFIEVTNPMSLTSRTDIQFIKDSVFYVVAYRTDTLPQTVVLRTEDAGVSWDLLFEKPYYPSAFYMHNDSFGLVGTSLGYFYRTTNRWQTTEHQVFANTIRSIYFLNDSVGLIGGKGSALLTNDSGDSWEGGRFFDSGTYIRSFSQTDDTTIFSTGSPNQNDYVRIYRSSDTGATKQIVFEKKFLGRRISEIKCFSSGECIAIGKNTSEGKALLYRTLDSGDTWYEIEVPTSRMLYNIEFANDSIAFIGGEDGVLIRMNRNLLPPPPDTTDTINAIFDVNNEFDVQVFPNPFDNLVSIHSNQLIREIQFCSLFNEVLSTYSFVGKKGATLSTEFLPDGLYLLRIKTEKGTVTKRIVKTSH